MPAKVNKEVCIGCGACVGVCPVEAIKLDDDGKAGVDELSCIDCGACVATCPVGAISQ
ncbi:Ferredoxin [bioreactor metagenome]|uniref:Ferredoxin n=1 Tax=bioreactor metagenome TaxID=1076179 RepID=A0A645B773_9ZZZZ|nr:4Fe-4S binding protein [Erysipelotrichaceae bacterium]